MSVQVELSFHSPPTGALSDAIDVFVGDVTAAGLRVQWGHMSGVQVGGRHGRRHAGHPHRPPGRASADGGRRRIDPKRSLGALSMSSFPLMRVVRWSSRRQ